MSSGNGDHGDGVVPQIRNPPWYHPEERTQMDVKWDFQVIPEFSCTRKTENQIEKFQNKKYQKYFVNKVPEGCEIIKIYDPYIYHTTHQRPSKIHTDLLKQLLTLCKAKAPSCTAAYIYTCNEFEPSQDDMPIPVTIYRIENLHDRRFLFLGQNCCEIVPGRGLEIFPRNNMWINRWITGNKLTYVDCLTYKFA